jgi:hypothetical protein
MDTDIAILTTVIIISGLILLRIFTLRKWLKLNLEMRKDSDGRFDPSDSSFTEFRREHKRAISLQKHRIALGRARSPKIK